MTKLIFPAILLTFTVYSFMPAAFAQDNETAAPPVTGADETAPEEPEARTSQEVEINEDNYRQFMELKDANLERGVVPENVFKPGTGLQKLDKLPEASQKHLRNELREIIVQGDPWQPGDEDTEYPYVPSETAGKDPALQNQEMEAWGELVGSYHQREAQIYENSAGSRAARGSEPGSYNAGSSPGSTRETGQSGEGSESQQAAQEDNPDQSDTEGTYSLNGSSDSSANSTAGVSQNAMEFLQGLGKGGNETGEGSNGDAPENGDQGESPTASEAQSQAQTDQQDSSEPGDALTGNSPNPPWDPNAKSTAGSSQNAMEFLKGNTDQGKNAGSGGIDFSTANGEQGGSQSDQSGGDESNGQQSGQDEGQQDGQAGGQETGQESGQNAGQGDDKASGQDTGEGGEDGQNQDGQQTETAEESEASASPASKPPVSSAETEEQSTAGASQNALEYLTGEGVQAPDSTDDESDTVQPEGTLTIQDLLNARGVGDSTGTDPASTSPVEEQQPSEKKPDKDGGG